MFYLLAVSILWGFSFGLVKTEFSNLSGPTLATMRLLIALPCFLPFLKKRFVRLDKLTLRMMAIGGIQYGLMYVCLFSSFTYLSGYEVALLTIFTPLYVIAVDALLKSRVPPIWFWITSLIAVFAALWIFNPQALPGKASGILLMQVANLCFAFGQVAWRELRRSGNPDKDIDGYALLYLGAVLFSLPFAIGMGNVSEVVNMSTSQWLSLLYLGAIASGLGFFLWNVGAVKVNPASLAVFNNLKIPLATVISIFIFKESADLHRLVPGLVIMVAALIWAEIAYRKKPTNGE